MGIYGRDQISRGRDVTKDFERRARGPGDLDTHNMKYCT